MPRISRRVDTIRTFHSLPHITRYRSVIRAGLTNCPISAYGSKSALSSYLHIDKIISNKRHIEQDLTLNYDRTIVCQLNPRGASRKIKGEVQYYQPATCPRCVSLGSRNRGRIGQIRKNLVFNGWSDSPRPYERPGGRAGKDKIARVRSKPHA